MMILFLKVGILPLIDDARPPDADAKWDKCDQWTFSEIFFSCGVKQQLCLDETMSARQGWEALADLYQSASLGNIFRLTVEFNDIKQLLKKQAIQFITSVCTAASELKYLGEDISDQKGKW